MRSKSCITVLASCLLLFSVEAFVSPSHGGSQFANSIQKSHQPSPTLLNERQWNFNEGQGPWGLKKNAEIWNGRVAQMAFVWIFLQELVCGKGVITGINEGDLFFLVNAGLFGLTVVGLTGFLALKGDNDYTLEDYDI